MFYLICAFKETRASIILSVKALFKELGLRTPFEIVIMLRLLTLLPRYLSYSCISLKLCMEFTLLDDFV